MALTRWKSDNKKWEVVLIEVYANGLGAYLNINENIRGKNTTHITMFKAKKGKAKTFHNNGNVTMDECYNFFPESKPRTKIPNYVFEKAVELILEKQ